MKVEFEDCNEFDAPESAGEEEEVEETDIIKIREGTRELLALNYGRIFPSRISVAPRPETLREGQSQAPSRFYS